MVLNTSSIEVKTIGLLQNSTKMKLKIQVKADSSVLMKLFSYAKLESELNQIDDWERFIPAGDIRNISIIFYALPQYSLNKVEDRTKYKSQSKTLELHINLEMEVLQEVAPQDAKEMLVDFLVFHMEEYVQREGFDNLALATFLKYQYQID